MEKSPSDAGSNLGHFPMPTLTVPSTTDVLNLLPSNRSSRRQASVRKSIRQTNKQPKNHALQKNMPHYGQGSVVSASVDRLKAGSLSPVTSMPLVHDGSPSEQLSPSPSDSQGEFRKSSFNSSLKGSRSTVAIRVATSSTHVSPLSSAAGLPTVESPTSPHMSPVAPLKAVKKADGRGRQTRSASNASTVSRVRHRREKFAGVRPTTTTLQSNVLHGKAGTAALMSLDERALMSLDERDIATLSSPRTPDLRSPTARSANADQSLRNRRLSNTDTEMNCMAGIDAAELHDGISGSRCSDDVGSQAFFDQLEMGGGGQTLMERLRWKLDLYKARTKDFQGVLSLNLSIWHGHLKTIEGKFGTGVVAYFVLLRGMVLLNMLLFMPIVCFMMIPMWTAGIQDWRNVTLTKRWYDHFADTLTGGGYLYTTPLFYSAYSPIIVGSSYSMPEAYFYTCISVMLISVVIISMRTYRSYKVSLTKDKENFYSYTGQIFGGWDYSISNEESARVKSISIHKNLLEEIAFQKANTQEWTTEMKVQAYTRRAGVNIFIFCLLTLASLAIYYASDFSLSAVVIIQQQLAKGNEASATLYIQRLAASLTIACFDVAAPIVFGKLAEYEQWRTPREEVKYTLYRTIFLKLSSLAVLMVSLFVRIKGCDGNNPNLECQCWESVLAQELWQLSVVTFIFIAFSVLVGQFVWRIMWERFKFVDTILGPPEFQIAKYVLELIFIQALVWLGYYFSPGMPLIVTIQLFLLFYVQMYSLFFNLQPSQRQYRAGSDDVLQILMLATLLLVLFPLGYAFVTIPPSKNCGPFRNYTSTFSVTQNVAKNSPTWVVSTLKVIFSSVVLVPMFIVFMLVLFFYYARQQGQRQRAHVLKEHLITEGKDKQFLIAKVASQQGIIHGLANRLMEVQKRLLEMEEANLKVSLSCTNLPDTERMMDELSLGMDGSDEDAGDGPRMSIATFQSRGTTPSGDGNLHRTSSSDSMGDMVYDG